MFLGWGDFYIKIHRVNALPIIPDKSILSPMSSLASDKGGEIPKPSTRSFEITTLPLLPTLTVLAF
jgi:hypothetical protein